MEPGRVSIFVFIERFQRSTFTEQHSVSCETLGDTVDTPGCWICGFVAGLPISLAGRVLAHYLGMVINSFRGSNTLNGSLGAQVSKWPLSRISVNQEKHWIVLVPDPTFLPLILSDLGWFLIGLSPVTRLFWSFPQECLEIPRCMKPFYRPQPYLKAAFQSLLYTTQKLDNPTMQSADQKCFHIWIMKF